MKPSVVSASKLGTTSPSLHYGENRRIFEKLLAYIVKRVLTGFNHSGVTIFTILIFQGLTNEVGLVKKIYISCCFTTKQELQYLLLTETGSL